MSKKSITISNSDKLSFIGTFSTMINAGIPILETMDSLLEDAKGNTKKILESMRADIVQGESLYAALSKFPLVFDKVTVNVVKASEEAGTLDVVLKDLKNQIQKDIEFGDSVKSAITYPIVIFVMFLAVLILILVVVVPKIATVFLSLRVPLPLPTRILIFASNIILHQTIPLIVALILINGGIFFLYKTRKQLVLNIIFSLPFVSKLIKEIDLARFFRSMYLLLTSGITITTALELARDVVLRTDISHAIAYGQETVSAGKKLSEAFKGKKNIFPGVIIKILESGEKTGTLDKSMEEISNYMDYQVSSTLKTLIALLEPLMLVVVGVLVGGMMMAIIAPIYGLISQVGGR